MIRYIFVFTLFLFTTVFSFSQETIALRLVNSEPVQVGQSFIGKDIYDNTYYLKGSTLRKIGKFSEGSYTNATLDSLDIVDISQPLDPMLFYTKHQTMVLLSRELAQLNTIQFSSRFPNTNTIYAGSSTNRRFWMLDGNSGTIHLYNSHSFERYPVFVISDLEGASFYATPTIFYWIDKHKVLKGVNVGGTLVVDKPLDIVYDKIQIVDPGKILYLKDNKIYYLDLKRDKTFVLGTKEESIQDFFYNTQKISIFVNDKMNNYLIKLP